VPQPTVPPPTLYLFVFQKSILDANEDDQIAAAIKASIAEKVFNGTDPANNADSDQKQVDCSSSKTDEAANEENWKSYLGVGNGKYYI
jgi:hypothetical protein